MSMAYKELLTDKCTGNTFLDLCCGPTVHWSAAPSLKYSDITLADLLKTNLVQVNKWLQKDRDALDWTTTFKWAADAEGISDQTVIEDRVRKAVKQVVLCDVLQDNPLLSGDSAAQDPDSLKLIIKNISNVVKPGGALVMINTSKATYYKLGSQTLPKMYITKETLKEALVGAGFEGIEIVEIIRSSNCQRPTDTKGTLLSAAFKSP